MKVQISMRKTNGGLIPASAYAEKHFRKIGENKLVLVTVHQARNVKHNDKYHAISDVVADNCDDFHDGHSAIEWVKTKMPWMVRSYRRIDGVLVIQTKSSDAASMDQLTFNKFYDLSLELWSARLGVDVETLKKEAE